MAPPAYFIRGSDKLNKLALMGRHPCLPGLRNQGSSFVPRNYAGTGWFRPHRSRQSPWPDWPQGQFPRVRKAAPAAGIIPSAAADAWRPLVPQRRDAPDAPGAAVLSTRPARPIHHPVGDPASHSYAGTSRPASRPFRACGTGFIPGAARFESSTTRSQPRFRRATSPARATPSSPRDPGSGTGRSVNLSTPKEPNSDMVLPSLKA